METEGTQTSFKLKSTRLQADPSIYMKEHGDDNYVLTLYVDDIKFCQNRETIMKFKGNLKGHYNDAMRTSESK